MAKALFLDRDGIFNEVLFREGHLRAPRNRAEVKPCADFDAAELPKIKALGYLLILVTNQPDIERGLLSPQFIEDLHHEYQTKFGLDAIYTCPFSSNDHPWKKPNPGLFLLAAQNHSLALSECFHLGDTDRDLVAARRCGCRSLLWSRPYNTELVADFRVSSLQQVREILYSNFS